VRNARLTLALAAVLASQPIIAATPPAPSEFARRADTVLADVFPADAPGVAVLVMRGDEVLYRGAHGEADAETDVPLKPGDRFRIGSVTKQIASAGLLTLVDAGKVSLDAPVSKYLPDFPGGAGITIEQLLNHTSGIQDYALSPEMLKGSVQADLTSTQLVGYFRNESPQFAPGEAWLYNNSGYVLVGAVIEAASGQPWHQYLAQALFAPLGMKDTGYLADPEVIARQVKGYTIGEQGVTPAGPPTFTELHAPGGLVSSIDDLARFCRALHEGHLLKPATYARMITPVGKAKDVGYGYGYGFETSVVRGAPAFQHSGGTSGFTSSLTYVQGPDVIVAVLSNNDIPSPAQDGRSLARRFAAAALGDPYPEAKPVAVPAAVLEEYEGVYRVDESTTRILRVVDGKLTAQRTDRPRLELAAISDDTFIYPDGFDRIRMERDAAGKVTGMRLWPDGEGDGEVAERTDQALQQTITIPHAALERLIGVYRTAQDMEMSIAIVGDALHGHVKGQPEPVPFAAITPNHFTGDAVGAELTFAPDTGPAQRVTLRQWGDEMVFERVPVAD